MKKILIIAMLTLKSLANINYMHEGSNIECSSYDMTFSLQIKEIVEDDPYISPLNQYIYKVEGTSLGGEKFSGLISVFGFYSRVGYLTMYTLLENSHDLDISINLETFDDSDRNEQFRGIYGISRNSYECKFY